VGDEVVNYRFTEAWRVNPRRQRRKIDQNGTDFFLVPREHVDRAAGRMWVRATAWFEPGPIDPTVEEGEDEALWGFLFGSNEVRAVPEGAQAVRRQVRLRWAQGGPVRLVRGVDEVTYR
jgi:hypothetical protein